MLSAETGAGAGAGERSSHPHMSSNFSSYLMNRLCPPENITVSFHPHPLRLKDAHETAPYDCVGCKEKGLGKYYQCENCDYHLHQQCYDLSESGYSSSIKFTFLESKKCDFVFQKEAVPERGQGACDACGKDVKGWFYGCKMCKKPHYLHPRCAHLPNPNKEGVNQGIVLHLTGKPSSKCQKCNSENISRGLRGWFYVSNCGKHCYHVACVMDMVLENLENLKKVDGCDDDHQIKESTDGTESCRSAGDRTGVQNRAITKRSGKGTTMKFLTAAIKIVLDLIISAIFGIPITSAFAAFYDLF